PCPVFAPMVAYEILLCLSFTRVLSPSTVVPPSYASVMNAEPLFAVTVSDGVVTANVVSQFCPIVPPDVKLADVVPLTVPVPVMRSEERRVGEASCTWLAMDHGPADRVY